MSKELKPCPFCGSKEAELQTTITYEQVVCCNCGARSGYIWLKGNAATDAYRRNELVAAWNRRAGHSLDAGEVVRIARPAPGAVMENCDIFAGADGENPMSFRVVESTPHFGNSIIVAKNHPKAAEVLALLNSGRFPDARPAPVVPDGWVCVPQEGHVDMDTAASSSRWIIGADEVSPRNLVREIIAAAPPAPLLTEAQAGAKALRKEAATWHGDGNWSGDGVAKQLQQAADRLEREDDR